MKKGKVQESVETWFVSGHEGVEFIICLFNRLLREEFKRKRYIFDIFY